MSIAHNLLVRFLAENASILEIGCGSSRDAAFLIAKGYDVTAIEASPKIIEAVVRLHPELADRITLASVPLRDSDSLFSRQFGAVVCIGTIARRQLHLRMLIINSLSLELGRELRNLPFIKTWQEGVYKKDFSRLRNVQCHQRPGRNDLLQPTGIFR